MEISIIGLGWFGESLAESMKSHHKILGTTRSEDKVREFSKQGIHAEVLEFPDLPSERLLNSPAVVLNIPPFEEQAGWLKSWPWSTETHVVFISSTSIYGKQTGILTEETIPQPSTDNGLILLNEETWIKNTFKRYTIIRFGGLFGKFRHPGKNLSGRIELEGGNEAINLVHLDDCVGFTKKVIETGLSGETYNLVFPDHPSREAYYTDYCLRNKLPVPTFKTSSGQGRIISSAKVEGIYEFKKTIYE